MKGGGATLDCPFCHVYRFHDDKAVAFQQYTDTAQWARLMAEPTALDAATRVRLIVVSGAQDVLEDRDCPRHLVWCSE